MPSRVRIPYIQYIENTTIFNTIAGAAGKDCIKRTGIPQEDPPLHDDCGHHYATVDD